MKNSVLIYDTDPHGRCSLSSLLGRNGFRVLEAESLDEAQQIVYTRDVDVALLDLRNLGDDGLSAISAIKSMSSSTEIILLTSPERIALSIRAMKLGAFDDLMVPLDVDLLLSRIRAACEHRRNPDDAPAARDPRAVDEST